MSIKPAPVRPSVKTPLIMPENLHKWMVLVLQAIMAVELAISLVAGQWQMGFTIIVIMAVIAAPILFHKQLPVNIPPEFQLLAILFIFASLFLGEVRSYYERIWWWDIALHASSGLLLGILGFLLVYVLNENERADIHMRPGFMAIFGFSFAVTTGALWEIFEFSMDRIIGSNMQKPMLGDPSGLTDTMWDLIVDSAGALVVTLLGWSYMKRKQSSFIEVFIRRFIERNPKLFRSGRKKRTSRIAR